MFHSSLGLLPWLAMAVSHLANAACECGYSLNKTSDPDYAVFTELLENDFLHTQSSSVKLSDYGWRPQVYNMTAEASRGPFGKKFNLENVVTNPLKEKNAWSGDSAHGGDAGLELWVRGDHSSGFVTGAEMTSVRNDTLLGSYRVGMKLSNSSGTCGAFFFFYNNSQEIDMEFLSHQFNASQGAVNLVLQTPDSVQHGFDAAGTAGFKVEKLPFRPDAQFHEYRFDWTRERVAFYVDGNFLHQMTSNMPSEGGSLFLNHWSNGNPLWSSGPPQSDTVMTVSYMKAYFNSTDTDRSQTQYRKRCPTYDPAKVCAIPSQVAPPDPANGSDGAKTYFFSQQKGMTPGQTVYNSGARGRSRGPAGFAALMVPLLVVVVSQTGWFS